MITEGSIEEISFTNIRDSITLDEYFTKWSPAGFVRAGQ